MSLNWNVAEVKDYRDVCYERLTPAEAEKQGTTTKALLAARGYMASRWCRIDAAEGVEEGAIQRVNPVTHCLIFACIGIGMNGITEDNVGEVVARIALMEKLHGPYLSDKDPETGEWVGRPITVAEVQAHVGLVTNVPEEPWVVWVGRVLSSFRSNTLRATGLPDYRGPFWDSPVSQVMEDLARQLDGLRSAMDSACYGDSAEDQFGWDYDRILDTTEWLTSSAIEWKAIEAAEEEE